MENIIYIMSVKIMPSNAEHDDMIQDCMNRETKMNDWEIKFIADLEYCEILSDPQAAKLEKIWDRVTS